MAAARREGRGGGEEAGSEVMGAIIEFYLFANNNLSLL